MSRENLTPEGKEYELYPEDEQTKNGENISRKNMEVEKGI